MILFLSCRTRDFVAHPADSTRIH